MSYNQSGNDIKNEDNRNRTNICIIEDESSVDALCAPFLV
jgi:hypothetical protein